MNIRLKGRTWVSTNAGHWGTEPRVRAVPHFERYEADPGPRHRTGQTDTGEF